MELDQVVPWGRNRSEYIAMFDLKQQDLAGTILGVGDGPASFNAECRLCGDQVTSVDPLYQFSAPQIAKQIDSTYPLVMAEVSKNHDDFIWSDISNPDMLGQARMQAMQAFLEDYQQADARQRYINASLPTLPFAEHQFDLALCSHFLFLYSHKLDLNFHLAACRELCRVAREVRIYPLVTLDNSPSPHVDSVMESVRFLGLEARRQPVHYQFQRGATEMLVIQAAETTEVA